MLPLWVLNGHFTLFEFGGAWFLACSGDYCARAGNEAHHDAAVNHRPNRRSAEQPQHRGHPGEPGPDARPRDDKRPKDAHFAREYVSAFCPN